MGGDPEIKKHITQRPCMDGDPEIKDLSHRDRRRAVGYANL